MWSLFVQIHCLPNVKLVRELVQTLLIITHLDQMKSYLVIIFPNSQANCPNVKSGPFESVRTLLKITHLASWKSYVLYYLLY